MVGLKFWGGKGSKDSSVEAETEKLDEKDVSKPENNDARSDGPEGANGSATAESETGRGRMKNVHPEPVGDDEHASDSANEQPPELPPRRPLQNLAQPNIPASKDNSEDKSPSENPSSDAEFGSTRVKKINLRDASPGATAATRTGNSTPRGVVDGLNIDEVTARMIREDQREIHGPTAFDRHASSQPGEGARKRKEVTEEMEAQKDAANAEQNLKKLLKKMPKDEQQTPVLTEDDEQFLQRVTSEMEMPLPTSRRATLIADDGEVTEQPEEEEASPTNGEDQAKNIPLPAASSDEKRELSAEAKQPQTWKQRWNQMSFVPASAANLSFPTANIPSMPKIWGSKPEAQSTEKTSATAPIIAPVTTSTSTSTEQTTKSNIDLLHLLSTLNLSTLNNRAIGISHDTQALLESFNFILKDLINGAPTAYHDLEKLLKDKEGQLDKLFGELPPFLQTLVRSVPVRMYAVLAPQLAAAIPLNSQDKATINTSMSTSTVSDVEEAGDGKGKGKSGDKKKAVEKKKRSLIPSLKSLIVQKGAVAAMLRSILGFLEMRFPAILMGTNVLMSLAVFILLFVFWYCHKRGKEARLLQSIDMYPDPSLGTLEKSLTLEKSGEVQRIKYEDLEAVHAAEVPLGAEDEVEDGEKSGREGAKDETAQKAVKESSMV